MQLSMCSTLVGTKSFLSPTTCSSHNRHTILGKDYVAKVMFQVLIEPDTYDISAQTVDPKNANIDEHFDNGELEWSTKSHVSIILHHMYIKLERQ